MGTDKRTPASASSGPSWHYPASLIGVGVVTFLLCGLIGGWVTLKTSSDPTHHPSIWGAAVIIVLAAIGWNTGLRIRERHRFGMPLWAPLSPEQAHTLAQYRVWARTGKLSEPDAEEMALAGKIPGAPMVDTRRRCATDRTSDAADSARVQPPARMSARDRRRLAEVQRQQAALKARQSKDRPIPPTQQK